MSLADDRSSNFRSCSSVGESDGVTWDWQSWEGLPYLTCSLLSMWDHGFFTRDFSPYGPIDLTQVLSEKAPVYRLQQVHGNAVLKTNLLQPVWATNRDPSAAESYAEADGLVTQAPGEAVWVCSADCVPVLIADDRTLQVAAVHAGWRGTAAKILPEAIAQLNEELELDYIREDFPQLLNSMQEGSERIRSIVATLRAGCGSASLSWSARRTSAAGPPGRRAGHA